MSGVAGLARGITSINRLRASIKALPLRIRTAVAKDAAEILTDELRADFKAGRTVYDTPRPLSVDGQPLSLVSGRGARHRYRHQHASTVGEVKALEAKREQLDAYRGRGHVKDSLAFVQIGTIIRAQLGQPYAKYLVGKYKILPQRLPVSWQAKLETIVREYAEDFEREAMR